MSQYKIRLIWQGTIDVDASDEYGAKKIVDDLGPAETVSAFGIQRFRIEAEPARRPRKGKVIDIRSRSEIESPLDQAESDQVDSREIDKAVSKIEATAADLCADGYVHVAEILYSLRDTIDAVRSRADV